MRPEEFVAKWRNVNFGEKQASQELFLDICALVEHPTPVAHGDRDGYYTFGVLHSRFHELWARGMGTQLHSLGGGVRLSLHPDHLLRDFPVPEPSEDQRASIAGAAARVNQLREGWLNPPNAPALELKKRTLTKLYNNQRPTWLANVHAALDVAVAAAYGWPDGLSDVDILERLLALNLQRAAEPANG